MQLKAKLTWFCTERSPETTTNKATAGTHQELFAHNIPRIAALSVKPDRLYLYIVVTGIPRSHYQKVFNYYNHKSTGTVVFLMYIKNTVKSNLTSIF